KLVLRQRALHLEPVGIHQHEPAQPLGIADRQLRGEPAAQPAAHDRRAVERQRLEQVEQPEHHVLRAVDAPEGGRVVEARQARRQDRAALTEQLVPWGPLIAARVVQPQRRPARASAQDTRGPAADVADDLVAHASTRAGSRTAGSSPLISRTAGMTSRANSSMLLRVRWCGTLPTEKFGMSVPSPVWVAISLSRSRTVAGLPTTT